MLLRVTTWQGVKLGLGVVTDIFVDLTHHLMLDILILLFKHVEVVANTVDLIELVSD